MAMKLTEGRIRDLVCPDGRKDALVFDEEQAGLGVRATGKARKGSLAGKTYLVQYPYAGDKRRVPLGSCSAISLAMARNSARRIMGAVAAGKDPAAERKAAALQAKRDALTLGALIDQWAKLHLATRRANYSTAAVGALRRSFARRLEAPAADLDRPAVVRVLDDLAADGKAATAGALARYGSALYGWAIRRESLSVNPFERVPAPPPVRRERVLSDGEVRRIWKTTEEPGAFNAIVRALLLTGQRREEVAGMTWAELDPDLTVWTLPAARSKNGKPHLVPLSREMQTLLCGQSERNRARISWRARRLLRLEQIQGTSRPAQRRPRLDPS